MKCTGSSCDSRHGRYQFCHGKGHGHHEETGDEPSPHHPDVTTCLPLISCITRYGRNGIPETRGNENVEVTEAITPMIEIAKAIVSSIFTSSCQNDRFTIDGASRTENSRLNSAL